MRDFKKYTSTKIRQQLERDGHDFLLSILRRNARCTQSQVFKLWEDRFDDLVIDSEETLTVKIEYIHNNPVRAGLALNPEDWKYSSARNYLRDDHSVLPVATDWLFGSRAKNRQKASHRGEQ
jgi:putative transposase